MSSTAGFSPTDPTLVRALELVEKYLPSSPTLWLKPPGTTPFHHQDSLFYHPWYPEHQRLLANGWTEVTELEPVWERIVLFGGKQKQENRQLIDRARSLLAKNGKLYFVLPNEYGGRSFTKELDPIEEFSGRKSRLTILGASENPAVTDLDSLESNADGFSSSPGLFSWERIDAGSKLLAEVLSKERIKGRLADLGAGWGYLSQSLPKNLELHLLEADRRGLKAAQENLKERNAHYHWCDVTSIESIPKNLLGRLDTVITNPPFHTGKKAEPVLGGAFVATAQRLLNNRGRFYMVGNLHLPYVQILKAYFKRVEIIERSGGYQILKGYR